MGKRGTTQSGYLCLKHKKTEANRRDGIKHQTRPAAHGMQMKFLGLGMWLKAKWPSWTQPEPPALRLALPSSPSSSPLQSKHRSRWLVWIVSPGVCNLVHISPNVSRVIFWKENFSPVRNCLYFSDTLAHVSRLANIQSGEGVSICFFLFVCFAF